MRNNRLPEPVIRVKQPALARFSPDVSPLFVHFRADDDVTEEINRDHVMLRYQGKIERLSLAEEGHSTVAVTNKKAVSDEAKQAVAEPAASAPVEIPTAVRQALTKDPQKIFNYIQLTPVRKEGIFPLPQGQIAVTLRDAQACFNLNALAQPTTASRPLAVQQLIALISRLDVPAYRYVMNTRKVHTDDTPVKVLAPGQKKAKTGRIWTYVRDDRNVGSSSPPAVWFAYSPNRQGKHPEQHLRPFRGILQADAFTGYDRLFSAEREGGALTEVACWAHARRKIHDVYISSKSATAEEALKRISELYAIEDEIRGLPESERLAARQQRSKALLTSLHEWMVEKNGTLSKKSRLGEAFSYVLNQWDALCYYSDDGLAEADNNTAERALRAVCLGKKNYVFFGSDHGGERGALLYGLIGTCRLNGIDPEAYLRHILSVLPEWPSNRVDELLPWNVVLTNK